ncbi:ribonuclease [Erythrobacter insulae]|uniref:Ribonuclease n=1 Tax=Erythrobacter insulae TaxID=2584124 RepID=A0A547P8X1_9SPHN|nr:ribonuclease E/G [Erythrobacter insulae]TRD10591.1 ribonuclease [Erythrobacter insulae]
MAEWLIEEGIGEHRALLVENDEVCAAKVYWPGELYAGMVASAHLTSKNAGARRGTAHLHGGTAVLVDQLPRDVTEGAQITLRIVRAPIAERGRLKLAQARFCTDDAPVSAAPLPQGKTVRRFPAGLWEEVWPSAAAGALEFEGGSLLVSPTPAMTLIDIDCSDIKNGNPGAIPAIAKALRWFDIGGNIGVDFPTITEKSERKRIDALLDKHLSDWPHERTAMNGFGFVQLVARLEGPSLLQRFATSRTAMCARMALRRAEQAEGHGVILMTVHPALKSELKPEWLDELARRTGKQVRIETSPSLALEAAQAQIIGS